ncbi:MAG TPA: Asp-tRNA(Asn)/Glu-tRNA(Gln) amidotransferase subunit GatB [Kiritimatiellia bacterium]|nr:Asp-tRNA(Asn)/Glu-tRNA(Gln) amidotransferase subunit GatB [Kiritimatiellia bacterium]HNS81127.1 Asp-tRNA(Asn)/Glu-tRNA(Gln) amidotransferase subunit GatB [Kiritimatiellia bacterium]HPA79047.1 Asp-tRNA(Asn)/Glu-tRNA(Gln) amidotransferase subunit GatB [Kiritimatiellia bacterium]
MNYKVTIGLETHVQLKTQSKIFCGCRKDFGDEPNTHVCPVCLGYPGAMPVLNEEAVRLTVMTGLMIGCKINSYSKFDRKSYFYPDMPKNYQISQYDQPLCLGGSVEIETEAGKRSIEVTRIHLEEDVAKNIHFENFSGVDFNRAGTPLMEIVTEPVIESADEAFAYLQALKQILVYGGISDCNLEEGNMRCDVNCSVRPEGQEKLGVKTELKNMNTFKGVHRALKAEIARQISVLEKGGTIQQETRRWDDVAGVTLAMRSKEYAHDYRYFPEPDLMPVVLDEKTVEEWRCRLPELPAKRRERMTAEYGIPEYDAGVLAADKHVADYFEETAKLCGSGKAASNWIMTEVMRVLSAQEIEIRGLKITPVALAALIKLVDAKTISSTGAKEVFAVMLEEGGDPAAIVKARGLAQVSDTGALEAMVMQAIAENEKSVTAYRAGKEAALQHLVGQVMKLSRGKANPGVVIELLKKNLA